MEQKYYKNLFYLNDVTGTGFWRRILPIMAADGLQGKTQIYNTYSMIPILDARYYADATSVTIQRWISNQHRQIFEKFLRPLTRSKGMKLIYEIDDAMGIDDIPLYNKGREHFDDPQVQENIKYMLNESDLVTVTTTHLKEYYNRVFGVPLEKIVAVPNLLSRMWIGDRYDAAKKVAQFKHYKSRPRIGIISSLSHYNLDGKKNEDGTPIADDLDIVAGVIEQTVEDFQWIIVGYVPPRLKKYAEQKKIYVYPMTPITTYPSMIDQMQLQAIVAPLQDNEFNRCKSPIKYMECSALGVPLFASNTLPYSPVMPRRFLFDTPDELKEKLKELKFMSAGAYQKAIDANWTWLNSERDEGDCHIMNFWLEDNVKIWLTLFSLNKDDEVKNNG